MLRATAFAAALLLGWITSSVLRAEDPPTDKAALPPSVADSPIVAKIEAGLKEPISLDIDESSLQDAVDYIKQKLDFDIRLDAKALTDAAIDPAVLITFHSKDIPLSSALDLILDDFELDYVVQHDVLRITSRDKADGVLIARVYPVADLANVAQTISGGRPRSNVSLLIQMIEDLIAPDSWDTNSGPGSIKPFRTPGGMAIVVSNTRRVQARIAAMFADLRALKQAEGDAEQQTRNSKTPYRAMYDLGPVSGPAMVKAITASVSPDTWQGKGGAGVISAVPVSVTENLGPTEAKANAPEPKRTIVKHWKLIVFQTDDVHRQLDDLLSPLWSKWPGMSGCSGGGFMRVSPAVDPSVADETAELTSSDIDR